MIKCEKCGKDFYSDWAYRVEEDYKKIKELT